VLPKGEVLRTRGLRDGETAVVLRHRQGLSFREVGEEIGCTEEAARKLWGRGILQLRRELGEWS